LLRRPSLVALLDAPRTGRQVRVVEGWQFLSRGRLPVLALPGRDLQDVHCVDFLECATVRLADEEVDDYCAGKTASCKHVAISIVNGGGDVRGDYGFLLAKKGCTRKRSKEKTGKNVEEEEEEEEESGLQKEIKKFHVQLLAVAKAMALARYLDG